MTDPFSDLPETAKIAGFQRKALVPAGALAGVAIPRIAGATNGRVLQVSLSPIL